ncbi:hypothetical protein [Bacillus nitratireducens]|nr:hypothetical protein [Bacillus nitratireducens]OSX89733.1 hypothetical protein BTJ45_04358 [Bacillus mycoides]
MNIYNWIYGTAAYLHQPKYFNQKPIIITVDTTTAHGKLLFDM